MPLISIILFFTAVGLFVLLGIFLKNKNKLNAAKSYGSKEFDIELPVTAGIRKGATEKKLPPFLSLSDAGAFFYLVTPYLGSLSNLKRKYIQQTLEDLKSELRIDKEIYRYFMDEYKIYDGLSDEQAAEKWSQK